MNNKRTCLYDKHVALGALIAPFAGFDMPIQYSGITEEHNAVRGHCGVFDVSHMGEVLVTGSEAEKYINHIFTNDVKGLPAGKVLYGMMCYPDGGVVDDTCICKLEDQVFLMTINASNIDKDIAWIEKNAAGFDVVIKNKSENYGQLALQGPEAEAKIESVLGISTKELNFYEVRQVKTDGEVIIVSRTGYTGEDGFEIYGSPKYINEAWDKLIAAGITPCGLGCRDTLRFEVGLPLYGNELSDKISPVMAGLSMFVKLDKEEFIGKDALQKQKAEGVSQRLRGIVLEGNAIPRHGYKVMKDGKEVGVVTTGYRLISTPKSCAVALVDASVQMGDKLEIQIRKKSFPGIVVKKKFYDKHYKK
ncbi:glycine cleavage system aminomethyltransferase GcvT [Prevotella veroralis]|uniref:Aminomethyltransferase n=1 Tax=Prevotella veroralis F0319 TaxID=649761 RepID=C9MKQ8_9BACT|nr:glycine cleavage system aminomethyltransferase GcvT [Prevotella veroralis]EEX19863.1 aminomethyltransferase [Prevotella veroralis F0319]QUB41687.1 glycine cleavage system aminomethyltransferase GcvT [Prevotella veroralis]